MSRESAFVASGEAARESMKSQVYNKGTISPLPPPPQSNDEGVKTLHFIIIEIGGRGGPNFPFILSKIVASHL